MDFMTMRVFLRGGYASLRGPTMVVRHGIPAFTVWPHGTAPAADEAVRTVMTQRLDMGREKVNNRAK